MSAAELASAVRPPRISVVIATIGGPSLPQTIARLNAGTLVPTEILVCVPSAGAVSAEDLPFDNVEVVVCDRRGQVLQRLFGFARARYEYVLQLDDDVHVDAHCVEWLLDALVALGSDAAVAPTLIRTDTGAPVYGLQGAGAPSRMERRFHGPEIAMPGRITRAGMNAPLDFSSSREPVNATEWLPGGCVLHSRANLVHTEYYPFPGKAYGEDVIHSVLLAQRGIRLFVVRDAICGMEPAVQTRSTVQSFLREMRAEWRWRRHLVSMTSGSVPHLALDIFFKYARRVLPALARRL